MKKILLTFLIFLSTVGQARVAPFFQADTLDGRKISLKETLKPKRMLLLSFWASWCAPCLEELKNMAENLKKNPTLPLDFLTVNVDGSETASEVKPTLKFYAFSFPVILDPKQDIFHKYREDSALPFSVLIAPNGEVAQVFSGYSEEMYAKIKEMTLTRAKLEVAHVD